MSPFRGVGSLVLGGNHSIMSLKLDVQNIAPETMRPLMAWGRQLHEQCGLDPKLLALIDIRASQINGCAFCIALHMRQGQALDDTIDRLTGVGAWRHSPWYSEKERAALAWTEALTRLGDTVPDETAAAAVRTQFTDREIVYLTAAITVINAFNRMNVGLGASPEGAEAVFQMLHSVA
jgi:AhpD family alkylhydroperoxidase